jgi:hypothetical protein
MRLHFDSAGDGAGRATRPASCRGLHVVTSSRRYDACGASVLLRRAGEQELTGDIDLLPGNCTVSFDVEVTSIVYNYKPRDIMIFSFVTDTA